MSDYNPLSVLEVYDLIKEKTSFVEKSADEFRESIIELYPAAMSTLNESSDVFKMKPASGLHRYLQLKIDEDEMSEYAAKNIMLKAIGGIDYEGFTRFNRNKLEDRVR